MKFLGAFSKTQNLFLLDLWGSEIPQVQMGKQKRFLDEKNKVIAIN